MSIPPNTMNPCLFKLKTEFLDKEFIYLSNLLVDPESKEYEACRFEINSKKVICRTSRVTPKKAGQFVTFWKRNGNGPIEPLEEADKFEYLFVIVKTDQAFGLFVFPKKVLISKGIISTKTKEGKRAFRVYPPWDLAHSKQARSSQKWQLQHFFDLSGKTDFEPLQRFFKSIK